MKKKPAKSKPSPAPAKPQEIYWAVMKMQSWSCLTVMGMPVNVPSSGPCRFIPVFETREQAVAWDNGSEEHVHPLSTVP